MILAAVFWGANYAATKFAALSMPPVSIVAVRFLVAGLLMYCVLRVLEPESRLVRKDLLPMAGLGCLGVAVGQTTFTFGVSMTSAANTGFIFATAPVWGLLFGFALGLERPTWRGTSGVGLSILGVGVIFYEGFGLEGANLIGNLLVLLAAMGFGTYTVLSMRLLGRYSPLAVATYPILFGGPLVLLISVPFFAAPGWGGVGAWAAVAFSAVFATAFAFSAWQTGVSRIGANRVLILPVPDLPHGCRLGRGLLRGGAGGGEARRRGRHPRGRVPGQATMRTARLLEPSLSPLREPPPYARLYRPLLWPLASSGFNGLKRTAWRG